MHRDHMLCSPPNADDHIYTTVQAIEFSPVPCESQSHEYPDLSHIRSEDLMPLCGEASQCLSQLIEQGADQAVHQTLEVLPDLEEHDKYGLKFELNLAPQQKGKVNWFYSKNQNKIYIKINEVFGIEVVYCPRSNNEKLFVRTMMVFNTEVSEPVIRCENHSSKDPANEKNIKHSVLRCENPNVTYMGTVEGKNVSDRLSVKIPLGCVQPNEDNLVKQTVALKFVCQNSCVGRRETSIIFYLENANGEVLAKRLTAVKVCSCPKRDMKKEETADLPKKRTRKDQCPVGKKILKLESNIKVEVGPETEKDDQEAYLNASEANDIIITPNSVRLIIDMPDAEGACHVLECAFNKVAGQMAMDPDNPVIINKFRTLKKDLAKLQRLREQQHN